MKMGEVNREEATVTVKLVEMNEKLVLYHIWVFG